MLESPLLIVLDSVMYCLENDFPFIVLGVKLFELFCALPLVECSNYETDFATSFYDYARLFGLSGAVMADKFYNFFYCFVKASYWSAIIIFLFAFEAYAYLTPLDNVWKPLLLLLFIL